MWYQKQGDIDIDGRCDIDLWSEAKLSNVEIANDQSEDQELTRLHLTQKSW